MQINLSSARDRITHRFSHLSVRNRLLLVTGLWVSLMIAAAGTIIPGLLHYQLEKNAQSELKFTLNELYTQLENGTSPDTESIQISNAKLYEKKQDRFWQIELEKNLIRSPSLAHHQLTDKHNANLGELIKVSEKFRLAGLGKVKITVAMDDDSLEDSLATLIGVLWFILVCLFIGVLVLSVIQVGWSLKPVTKMQQELIELKSGNISKLEGNYPQELSPLADSLNDLLFHYQELLQRARNHTGNMAHALKTPLTVLKNQINQYPNAERTALTAPIDDIQKYIDYHLGRARIAGSSAILSVKSSPSERVEAMNIAFDKVYAQQDILLINELDDELQVNVETTDLDEMLGNILENGYKWAKSTIRVYSQPYSDNRVNLIIEDDGKGIKDNEYQAVLQRGARLDETVKGSGLGLNIVHDIVLSYQGSIQLEKAQLGGLKVILTLPC